jgi:hypothetical protein
VIGGGEEREGDAPWRGELDLSIYSSRSQERRVENIDTIRRHDDLFHPLVCSAES